MIRSQTMAHSVSSLLALAAGLGLPGCAEPALTGNPVLVDPQRTSRESGATDDIYDATEKAITSMTQNKKVQTQKGRRIVLNRIVNQTGIPGYDENVIYNKFLGRLVNSAGDDYIFLNRDSVARERELQQSGSVQTSGVPALSGAEMVLDIELRQLPGTRTQTIQYTFRLTDLSGQLIWTDSFDIVKKT
jgi:hypothetical protein